MFHVEEYRTFFGLGHHFITAFCTRCGMEEKKVLFIYHACSVKMGLNAFAKTSDLRQPAQSPQADVDRNFSPC